MEKTVIVPGLYHVKEGEAYNVLGIALNTETKEKFVVCQHYLGNLHGTFRHIPFREFTAGVAAKYALCSKHGAPRLIGAMEVVGNPPGLYRHFKGGTYNLIGISRHLEIPEECAFYQSLYGEHRYQLALRPLSMFVEHVEKPEHNYRGPRFALLDAYEEPRIAQVSQD